MYTSLYVVYKYTPVYTLYIYTGIYVVHQHTVVYTLYICTPPVYVHQCTNAFALVYTYTGIYRYIQVYTGVYTVQSCNSLNFRASSQITAHSSSLRRARSVKLCGAVQNAQVCKYSAKCIIQLCIVTSCALCSSEMFPSRVAVCVA